MCYKDLWGCFTQVPTSSWVYRNNLVQLSLQMWVGQLMTGGSEKPLGWEGCLECQLASVHPLMLSFPNLSTEFFILFWGVALSRWKTSEHGESSLFHPVKQWLNVSGLSWF